MNKLFKMKQEKMSKELEDLEFNFKDATPSFLDPLFDSDSIVPQTIEESLKNANFKNVDNIIKECTEKVNKLEKDENLKLLKMTRDEAYAILAYTYEAIPNREESPYRVLNQALLDHDMDKLKTLRGFILNLLSALRKLRPEDSDCLYRGIDGKWLKGDAGNFVAGNAYTFTPFTSTSIDEKAAMKFIDRNDVYLPVFYEMHGNFPGYLIDSFSKFKEEKGKQAINY